MATVRYFAAAAEAAGTASESVAAGTLGELLDAVSGERPDEFARVLGRCSVLIDGVRSSEADTPVAAGATVDVLPPFAGG